ncbi:MAG: MaoC family dehydratase [Acidimicrobiales bacterium]
MTVHGGRGLAGLVGTHLGWTPWREVTQDQVDRFADATDDHQWIHVDAERAAEGPFGGTVAHGYLTLSLGPALLSNLLVVEGVPMALNYGANRVRFPAPVPVGRRLRMGALLVGLDHFEGGAQATLQLTFEVEGAAKPSCVAEVVYRFYG